jgi:hypothetical protein
MNDPILNDLGLSFGEDLMLKASIENLHSALRATLNRCVDRVVDPSDAPKILASFLRARAAEYEPQPPKLDPEASAARLREVTEEWQQVQVDFGTACGTMLTDVVTIVRDDMAIMIETDGANAIDARRQANKIMADNLHLLANGLT